MAVADARRSIAMFETLNVPVLGVIENMAGEFFGAGGGEALAEERGLPFLGRTPLQASIRRGGDEGLPAVIEDEQSAGGRAFQELSQQVAARISVAMLESVDVIPIEVVG